MTERILNNLTSLTKLTGPTTGLIDLELFAELLEDSGDAAALDLGPAKVYRVNHPVYGGLVLINSTEKNALIRL